MHKPSWWAKGLLFENCTCQLLCPAHVSFKQRCENDRCHGHWAVHIETGRFGDISIQDRNVVILFESSVLMYDGGWTERLYLDERADGPRAVGHRGDLLRNRWRALGNPRTVCGDPARDSVRAGALRGRRRENAYERPRRVRDGCRATARAKRYRPRDSVKPVQRHPRFGTHPRSGHDNVHRRESRFLDQGDPRSPFELLVGRRG